MLRLVFVMALLAALLLAAVPVLGTTWDLSTDWSAVNTTGGVWTVGDANLNWGPGNGMWQYNTLDSWWTGMSHWDMGHDYVLGMVLKNVSGAVKTGISGADYDVNEVGLFQGQTNVWGTQFHANVIRWTAPRDLTAISISAKFAQIFNGNDTANVDVKRYDPTSQDTTVLFSDSIQGYRGNASSGYSGAIGTHNTTTFNTTLLSVTSGQVIDFRVSEPTSAASTATNQTSVAVTIAEVVSPGVITGTVTSSHGGPIAGVLVSVDGQPGKTALTVGDGTYSVAVSTGTYALTFTKDGLAVGHLTGISVTSGSTTSGHDIVLHPSITGTVRSNAGGAVAGVLVSVDGQPGKSATTLDDGTYAIGIPAGTYSLTATKAGYGDGHKTGVVVSDSSETSGQDITLTFSGIAGTLTCAFNGGVIKPVGGANIIASNSTDSYVVTTNAAGYYQILPTASGTFTLDVGIAGYTGGTVNGVSFTVGSPTVQNLSVSHTQPWDFTQDFSSACNPNNQWSYGWLANQADDFRLHDAMSVGYGPRFPTTVPSWTTAGQQDAKGGIGRFDDYSGHGDPYYPDPNNVNAIPFPYFWYESGMGWMYNRGGGEACIRWTSPDARIIKLTVRVTSQCPNQDPDTNHQNEIESYGKFRIKKNGVDMYVDHVQGFIGRSENHFTDSIGPKPEMNFQTTLPVNPGDYIDLSQWFKYAWPYPLFGVWETVEVGTGDIVSSIQQIKGKADGTTVFLTTPMALICDTDNYTSDGSFYIESDDRSMTLKCINDGTVPKVTPDYKIEFTGTVDTVAGQKVVRVKSINNTVPLSSQLKPLGTTCKALAAAPMGANTNRLVKVWGKITSLVLNTDPTTNGQYKWEYALITDGSQTVKIPMHDTTYWIGEADSTAGLAEGQYIAVWGVAMQSGTDILVCPRSGYDFYNYTLNGR